MASAPWHAHTGASSSPPSRPAAPATPCPVSGAARSLPWRNGPAVGLAPPDPHPRRYRMGAHGCRWALSSPSPSPDVRHRPPLSSPRGAGQLLVCARVCWYVHACACVCMCMRVQVLAALAAAAAQPVGGAGEGPRSPRCRPRFGAASFAFWAGSLYLFSRGSQPHF